VRARFVAQLLAGPRARDPVAVAERLLAVQAQDLRGARLAVRARSTGLTAGDVDRALTVDRSLVIDWLNRGTLHLVRSEDYGWLHELTTPQLAPANARRLRQEGVTAAAADRGVSVVERALADEGPLTRLELRERLRTANVRTEGQALVHVLMLACLRGVAIRGPLAGRHHAYALVHDWLGPQPRVERSAALAELARRFLRGHGPADDRDLAKWAGLTLRDARAGFRAIAPELGRAPRPTGAKLPEPKLLGPWDPLLLGWREREPVLGRHATAVITGGLFRPFALVEGRAAATWSFVAGTPELSPLRRLRRAERLALDADAADVERFLSGA
jgi:hypothetical protein